MIDFIRIFCYINGKFVRQKNGLDYLNVHITT